MKKIVLILSSVVSLSAQTIGDFDQNFGQSGKVQFFAKQNFYTDLSGETIQSDGKIITAGGYYETATMDIFLSRRNVDGSLDVSFGQGGYVYKTTEGSTSTDVYRDVEIDNNGKIVATGSIKPSSSQPTNILVARYNSNGTLDSTFSLDGHARFLPVSQGAGCLALAIQHDNKLLLGIAALNQPSTATQDLAILRLNPNGIIDSTFGTNGIAYVDIPNQSVQTWHLEIQPNGKIVAGGSAKDATNNLSVALARYNSDGQVDNSFGMNGQITFIHTPALPSYIQGLALQSDGSVVIAGTNYTSTQQYDSYIVRYTASGLLDPIFGTNGLLSFPASPSRTDMFRDVMVDNMDRIVVVGNQSVDSVSWYLTVGRLLANGTWDNSFGVNGFSRLEGCQDIQDAVGVLFSPLDNSIVVTGYGEDSLEQGFGSIFRIVGENPNAINENNLEVSLYPNPVNSIMHIDYKGVSLENMRVDVLDPQGKIVLSMQNSLNEGDAHTMKVDLSSLSAGIYSVRIDNDKSNIIINKVVKL